MKEKLDHLYVLLLLSISSFNLLKKAYVLEVKNLLKYYKVDLQLRE